MRHLTIGVPDKLYDTLLALFKTIPSVIITEEKEYTVPEWQKKIVRERIKTAKPESFKLYSEVQKKLKKKYGI